MVALFVAFMFVILVLTDLGVEKWTVWHAARTRQFAAARTARMIEALGQVPEGVHISTAHTWLKPDRRGGVEIGADPFLSYATGAVRRIILPHPGEHVTAGLPLFKLERDGRSLAVPSTITGKVVAVNSRLLDQPGLLNSDPYGNGWICHVTPTSIDAVTPQVHFGEMAARWLESEFDRLREFLSARIPAEMALGATSQDGGLPSSGCLGELDNSAWRAFEAEFLKWK